MSDTSAYTDGSRVPKVESEDDIPELPLARYEFSDSDTERLTRAQARVAQRCMADFGFTDFPLDPALPRSVNTVGGAVGMLVAVAMSTPFGELDLDEARRFGYGWDPKSSDGGQGKKDRAMTDAEYRVFYNADRAPGLTVKGHEVPGTGCYGKASTGLTKGVENTTRMWTYTSGRAGALAKKALKDPEVSEALRTWSTCVEDKGSARYEDREAAFHDKAWHRGDDGNTRRTQRERTTAVADIECAREHNTVGVWWAGSARSQTADVKSHRAAYEAVRRDQDVVRANVRRALGD
ncbi:hypothetical protein [Streptomyces sp. NBC_01716]|uniref:hypothetical protein n=1 Tax=Streptomyces sp. NBC_01716 TaxID=2975917 RepID=UPI002E345768|nr:hypothetical protein [Streptomyces sp. NBC_01716]